MLDEEDFFLTLLAEEKLQDLRKPTSVYEVENTSKFGVLWGNFTNRFNI